MHPLPASTRIRMAMALLGVARPAVLRGISELLFTSDRLLASAAAPTAACGSAALQSVLATRWLNAPSVSYQCYDGAMGGASQCAAVDASDHRDSPVSTTGPIKRLDLGFGSPASAQPYRWHHSAPRVLATPLPQPNAPQASGAPWDAHSSNRVRWFSDSARNSSNGGSDDGGGSDGDSVSREVASPTSPAAPASPAAAAAAAAAPAVSAAAVADANDVLRVRWCSGLKAYDAYCMSRTV